MRFAEGFVETLGKLGPVAAELIEGPRGDQRFHHPLVAEPEIDSAGEIGQRGEGRHGPRRNHRLDGPAADVADRTESEAHATVAGDGELEA